MNCVFESMEDAGTNIGDYIMRVRWKPYTLQRWLGAQEESVSYYGQGVEWHPMYGVRLSPRVSKVLAQLWHEHQTREGNSQVASTTRHPRAPNITGEYNDVVQVASEGSFPASDPPAWPLGR